MALQKLVSVGRSQRQEAKGKRLVGRSVVGLKGKRQKANVGRSVSKARGRRQTSVGRSGLKARGRRSVGRSVGRSVDLKGKRQKANVGRSVEGQRSMSAF